MSKSANPVTIGVFVVGASILAMITIMVIGASSFFTRTETVICFFHDSVHGLDVGAPVKYKGVKIGKVEKINISVSKKDVRKTSIEVTMSVDLNMVKHRVTSAANESSDDKTVFYKQIDEGLRAQLAFQSVVTGMLYIELDYVAAPGDPYKIYNKRGLHEIPVSASGLSDLAKKLESTMLEISEIDFKAMGANLNALLVTANAKLQDVDTKKINEELVATLTAVREVASDEAIRSAIKNADKLLGESREVLANTGKTIDSVGEEAHEAMASLNAMLKNVNIAIAPNSPFRYEFSLLLKNLSDTLISVKTLADYIERNPNSIITGKPLTSKEQK